MGGGGLFILGDGWGWLIYTGVWVGGQGVKAVMCLFVPAVFSLSLVPLIRRHWCIETVRSVA